MSDVSKALKAKMDELDAEMEVLIEERTAEIQAARDKYADSLKAVMAKKGALKRMIKTATEKL